MAPVASAIFTKLYKHPAAIIIAFVGAGAPTVFPAYIKVDEGRVGGSVLARDRCISNRYIISEMVDDIISAKNKTGNIFFMFKFLEPKYKRNNYMRLSVLVGIYSGGVPKAL